MNAAVKTRLFQIAKTLQCRYFRVGQFEGILKIRSDRDVFIVQRGNSTKAEAARIHNLMRRKDSKGSAINKQEEIGPFGYFLLAIPISTFILGCWQIQRRQWKLALIDDLQKRVNSPPAPLPEDLSELETMEYHPIKIQGRFLHDREFIVGPKSLIINGTGASEGGGGVFTPGKSNTGFYVITPFKIEDRDLTILVNRGWVPLEYKKNRREAQTQSDELVEVTGVVRLNEKRPPFMPKNSPDAGKWYFRDLESMSKTAGTAPIYIELIADETVRGGPVAGQTRITLRNEHFSYIFTWFSLSLVTGWMWHRMFIRKLPLM